MIRIVIVDSTRLHREGLAQLLRAVPGVSVVGADADCSAAFGLIRDLRPDVVLFHLSVADNFAVLRRITETLPETRVVALGVSETEEEVVACAEGGAAGFFPRGGSLDDLVSLVKSVVRGEMPCSPRIAAALFRRVARLASERQSQAALVRLTPREQEILRLIDAGFSNKDISRRLSVEVRTVKSHVHNILEKLQVHRRGEAAARMRGTIAPPHSANALFPVVE